MAYLFARLRARGRDFRPAYDALRQDGWATLVPAKVWGAFHGLFGVASNELIVVTYGEVGGVEKNTGAPPGDRCGGDLAAGTHRATHHARTAHP